MKQLALGPGIFPSVSLAGGLRVVVSNGPNSRLLLLDRDGAELSRQSLPNGTYSALSPDGRWLAYQSEAAGWRCILTDLLTGSTRDLGTSQGAVALTDKYVAWVDLGLMILRADVETGELQTFGTAQSGEGVAYFEGDKPVTVWESRYVDGPRLGLLTPVHEAGMWIGVGEWGGMILRQEGQPDRVLAHGSITCNPHVACADGLWAFVAWDNDAVRCSLWLLDQTDLDLLPLATLVNIPPPVPVEVPHVEPLGHPLWLGCYFDVSGKYGDTAGLPVNLSFPGDPSDTARATLPVVISKLHIGSERTPVVALYCESGEPGELARQAAELHTLKPGCDVLGVCDGHLPAGPVDGVDILGLELYSDSTLREPAESVKGRVRACMDSLPAGQRLALIVQAFDHIGGYRLDWPGYARVACELARDSRVVMVSFFCAGRADSKLALIRGWIDALSVAIPGTPAITVPVQEPPPFINPEQPPDPPVVVEPPKPPVVVPKPSSSKGWIPAVLPLIAAGVAALFRWFKRKS